MRVALDPVERDAGVAAEQLEQRISHWLLRHVDGQARLRRRRRQADEGHSRRHLSFTAQALGEPVEELPLLDQVGALGRLPVVDAVRLALDRNHAAVFDVEEDRAEEMAEAADVGCLVPGQVRS
jgi:hypothetical protein